MTLSISRATPEDVETLVPLLDAYRVFYENPSDPDTARIYLQERLTKGEAVVFLARLDEQPAGFALLTPTFTSVAMRFCWYLNDLYVAPEARKQGVARALLDQARELAVETGAYRVQLRTAMTNTTAQRLYEDYGFHRDNVFYTYNLYL